MYTTILVFSDSHGSSNMQKVVNEYKNGFDYVFFLGDGERDAARLILPEGKPLVSVCGNCDYSASSPEEAVINVDGFNFLLTHGHKYGVKYGLDRCVYRGFEANADAVLFGHTHQKHEECVVFGEKKLYLFNPGAVSGLYTGDASFGVITISGKNLIFSHGSV